MAAKEGRALVGELLDSAVRLHGGTSRRVPWGGFRRGPLGATARAVCSAEGSPGGRVTKQRCGRSACGLHLTVGGGGAGGGGAGVQRRASRAPAVVRSARAWTRMPRDQGAVARTSSASPAPRISVPANRPAPRASRLVTWPRPNRVEATTRAGPAPAVPSPMGERNNWGRYVRRGATRAALWAQGQDQLLSVEQATLSSCGPGSAP